MNDDGVRFPGAIFFKIEVRGAQEGHGYGMLYDSSLLPNKAKVTLEV